MKPDIQYIFGKGLQLDDVHQWMDVCAKDEEATLAFWEVAKDAEQKNNWRALWIIEHAIKKTPALLDLILDELYELLISSSNHSLLRIGLKMVIQRPLKNEDITGHLLNKCEEVLLDTKMPVGTRANSLQFIYEFCKMEPDFGNELEALMEHIAQHESSNAMGSRIKQIRKALHKKGIK